MLVRRTFGRVVSVRRPTSSPSPGARRRRIQRPPTTIIVTDANHGISLPFIRSLGRGGWRVIAAGADRRGPGLRSRYVTERLVHPPAGRDPLGFAAAIGEAARLSEAALVIPLSEAAVLALTAYRHLIPPACQLALPDPSDIEIVFNKHRTIELAQRLGVPVPRTGLAHSPEEAADVAARMTAPFVLKPVSARLRISGRSRLGTLHAHDPRAVAVQAARLLPDEDGVLVQEYVAGHGVGVDLLVRDGRTVLSFQHRRIREVPVFGGPSALRASVALDPTLFRHATALLGDLRWTGLAMVEFRVTQDEVHLMEINGRAWGSISLAVAAGVDFPGALADIYLGSADDGWAEDLGADPPRSPPAYVVGVRSRDLQLDLVWALSVLLRRPANDIAPWPPRRAGAQALLQMFDPSIGFDVLSRDDPRPGAAELVRIGRYLIRQLAGR